MKKVILVDTWHVFITEDGINKDIENILNSFANKKILLTNSSKEQNEEHGIINMSYEVFTLSHNPGKSDPEYYKIMLEKFDLKANKVIYFEHGKDAVKAAQSLGIKTYWYDKNKKDIGSLREFIENNI